MEKTEEDRRGRQEMEGREQELIWRWRGWTRTVEEERKGGKEDGKS